MHKLRVSHARSLACLIPLLAAAATPAAWAQAQPPVGSITYAAALAGAAQPVPTLAHGAMVVLSLLMAPVAWRAARGRLACLALAAGPAVLAGALLGAAAWSGHAEARSKVSGGSDVLLNNPAGGMADIPYHAALDTAFRDYMYEYEVRNTTAASVRITGVTLTTGHNDRPMATTPRCVAGLVLAADETCYLLVSKPR